MQDECRTSTQPVVLGGASQDRLERRDDGGIKLSLDCLCEPQSRDATWHCVAVRTIRSHRVVAIGDGDDPCQKRNAVAEELVRVAVTIYALVMVPYDCGNFAVIIDVTQNSLADR